MGWTAWQWRFGSVRQRAVVRRDAIGQHAKLRAHTHVQETFIRADDHRLYLAWHINNLNQRECPFGI